MQMVQFLSTLQEAPRVVSDATLVACTTHSWEMFCCFSRTILGGIVSTDISITLPFILFRILLFFCWNICWLSIPFDKILRLSCSCRSLFVSYLTTMKLAASASRLSSALLTVITRWWNWPPCSFCTGMKFGLISVNMCTQRIRGTVR